MVEVERRSQHRYPVQRPVQVLLGDRLADGETQNLSLGGARIRLTMDPPPKMGDRLHVKFRVPGVADPIEADAAVRWIGETAIGIQFTTGFRAKETWALNQLFDQVSSQQGS